MRPILFYLGPVTISSYTFCMLAAFLIVGWLAYSEAKRRGRLNEDTLVVGSVAMLAGILGAKLSMLVFLGPIEFWRELPTILAHGSALFGGLTVAFFAVMITEYALKIERCTGDLIAPFLPLGQAIGRMGNFLAGDAYGSPSSLPWSVYQAGAYRHPAQLYELVLDLLLFAFLYRRRYSSFRDGELFSLYIAGYSLIRFPLEFLRYQPTPLDFLGLTLVQWMCLAGFLWSSYRLYNLRRASPGMNTSLFNHQWAEIPELNKGERHE
jgi:phosphatidylglycerol---prolipoprotein diacylglyceryl transferase